MSGGYCWAPLKIKIVKRNKVAIINYNTFFILCLGYKHAC